MTEVTDEARAELAAINAALLTASVALSDHQERTIMLALDKHHGRTPPDPMVAKAERLINALGLSLYHLDAFVAQLHKEFPDG